ncbi:ABC transporter permease [Enterococcus nangangensis]|uniref:ABC transporter permease n=1 Tax=Enterococcus nangangensis TaxID=2559926 RepID=UPI0010F76BD3|nr:ABC transporter permease [Enterococcus nangangensis]
MKKYLFFRIIRSIISIFLVTTLTYAIIYSLVPRRSIFKGDAMVSKLQAQPDKMVDYKNTAYDKMAYIDFYNSKKLQEAASKDYPEVTVEGTKENKTIYEKWAKENGWTISEYKQSKQFYATREVSLLTRVWRFYSNLIHIDHPWKVKDSDNPGLKRSIKITNDPLMGWSLVGSGTQYKYLIYFDSSFPFIHQNILHVDLGTSYPTYAGIPVSDVITGGQGRTVSSEVTFPNGEKQNSSLELGSLQYTQTSKLNENDAKKFGDNYTTAKSNYADSSMMGTSFKIGFVAVIITYLIAIPSSILMARFKNRLPDRIGVAVITILIATPSLAFIYFFRYLGKSLFNLPDNYQVLGAGDIRSYIMPTVILGLLGVSGMVIWVRRYMIDQQSADYVKFAKAKGLNSAEISRRHIFKNAFIPIVNGVPGSIIGAIGGATITESIFIVPGMGKMLPDAILKYNNPVVIGIVFIFTTVSVFSVLLGDIAVTLADPRVKLASGKGDN